MFRSITLYLPGWLHNMGFSASGAEKAAGISDFFIILLLGVILYYITKFIINSLLKRLILKTSSDWDDILLEKKVFSRMGFLVPGILVYQTIPDTLDEFPRLAALAVKMTNIYIVFIFMLVIVSFVNALYEIYQKGENAKFHPVKGYLQVAKIVIYTVGALLILSFFFSQSPLVTLGGLGAFSAILLLVFKDPILGFVGSLQLSANDMVRAGDWISMQKFGADGTVLEITLTTVKVQNFDNTVTTLPTYSLVSDSFQNFRGMQESGARRMKRAISIDMYSVRFCTPEMLDRFRGIPLIADFVDQKEIEPTESNAAKDVEDTVGNGRRQTNLGMFMVYLEQYLRHHPNIHHGLDTLVRQLQPGSSGIPVEIYAFTPEIIFSRYENIQSDIFGHILAIIPEFDLRVFQNPTGHDYRAGAEEGQN